MRGAWLGHAAAAVKGGADRALVVRAWLTSGSMSAVRVCRRDAPVEALARPARGLACARDDTQVRPQQTRAMTAGRGLRRVCDWPRDRIRRPGHPPHGLHSPRFPGVSMDDDRPDPTT